MKKEIIRLGGFYGQATRWGVYDKNALAPTMVASMGGGGGHTPMVIKYERNSSVRKLSQEQPRCK